MTTDSVVHGMWYQAMKLDPAHIVYPEGEAIIYKGIKIERIENNVKIYSSNTDFYEDITYDFCIDEDFNTCVNAHLKAKYLTQLDKVERWIRNEMNGSKNHKKISNLKTRRLTIVNKYNEISTEKITGR